MDSELCSSLKSRKKSISLIVFSIKIFDNYYHHRIRNLNKKLYHSRIPQTTIRTVVVTINMIAEIVEATTTT